MLEQAKTGRPGAGTQMDRSATQHRAELDRVGVNDVDVILARIGQPARVRGAQITHVGDQLPLIEALAQGEDDGVGSLINHSEGIQGGRAMTGGDHRAAVRT